MHFTKGETGRLNLFTLKERCALSGVQSVQGGPSRNGAHMKTLASQIERELQADKWKHCAVYENDLIRLWPLDDPEREAKIGQFAEEHGFRLRFYRQGMCAIFDKLPRGRS